MHTVIIVNGLGGEITPIKWATRHWHKHGLEFAYHYFNWKEKGSDIESKIMDLVNQVDSLVAKGHKVSLIGCSAGAGLMLNVFAERKDVVSHMINICGPLRKGIPGKIRSLDWWKNFSPLLIQSVERIERKQVDLTADDRKKIMTVRAAADELVPPNTVILEGAYNIQIPAVEHTVAIYVALTVCSGKLIAFLSTNN